MEKKRVVVTGLGLVSCFGTDVEAFYSALLQGKSGIKEITSFDVSEYPTRFAGEVAPFETDGYIDKKQARRVDPFIIYTMVAGKKALEMAGILGTDVDPKRAGVVVGSGMGGMGMFETGVTTLNEKGFKRLSPFFVPYIITNMAGALLAMDLGYRGPNYSISTACATSNHCIIAAAEHIRKGEADIMVCGGSEAPVQPIGLSGFVACRALSTRNDEPEKASRPWDKNRDGFVMGEGAGVLVLESLESAQKRGATILAEYLGGAVNCDAHHITEPHPEGLGVAECIEQAIADSEISKEQINYINAHATSTPAGDPCEVRAVKKFFGDQTKNITMNATKSMTGHCLGAAAGLEAIATVKAIQTGMVHPTINITEMDEELNDFNIPREQAEKLNITGAMSNSFGFGGHNATIILGPYNA